MVNQPNFSIPSTSGNQKYFVYFLILILIICFAVGPFISWQTSKDCKEQNDCDEHFNYLYHLGWFAMLPRLMGMDWGLRRPCIIICTKPKDTFYIDKRGFSVPLTDCSLTNKYTLVVGEDGNDNECADCPTINNLKTTVKTTCEPDETTPAGEPGRTIIKSGASISLGVSKGTPPDYFIIPDIINYSLKKATEKIQFEGLRLGEISYEYQPNLLPSTVIDQSFPSGLKVTIPVKIDLVISKDTHEK